MNNTPPLVSIAIRAYRRRWLHGAMAGVLGQTHRDLELVIYDDAGGLEDVAASFDDARVRYHRAERRRQASGRFAAAVALCRGRYIGVLDDDDWYPPDFVSSSLAALEADAEAGVAFHRITWVDEDGRLLIARDSRAAGRQTNVAIDMLSGRFTAPTSCMLLRKSALDAAGFAEMPDGVAPDFFINMRLALSGWHHVLVDGAAVVCRRHPDQLSRTFPTASDTAIASLRCLTLDDARLRTLRDRRIRRLQLVRLFLRVASALGPAGQLLVRMANREWRARQDSNLRPPP